MIIWNFITESHSLLFNMKVTTNLRLILKNLLAAVSNNNSLTGGGECICRLSDNLPATTEMLKAVTVTAKGQFHSSINISLSCWFNRIKHYHSNACIFWRHVWSIMVFRTNVVCVCIPDVSFKLSYSWLTYYICFLVRLDILWELKFSVLRLPLSDNLFMFLFLLSLCLSLGSFSLRFTIWPNVMFEMRLNFISDVCILHYIILLWRIFQRKLC